MNNINQVEKLIETYKIHLEKDRLKDELYKWQLLTKFKGRPRLDILDFAKEITSINFANLIYHSGVTVIKQLAEGKPEAYKNCFESLFDEKSSLTLRIKAFDKTIHTIYRELYANHEPHHDERTMSTFLTFHNPEKYTLYKNSFYKKYCQLLGIATKEKGEKYEHYLELIDDLIENYIKKDAELIAIFREIISSEDCYEDPNFKILAQDILYQMLENQVRKRKDNTTRLKKYWMYAPGKNAYLWDEFHEKGIMALGWDFLGDLNDYDNQEDIEVVLQQYENTTKSKKNDSNANFNFLENMAIGDVVFVKQGMDKLIGYGIITSDFYFDDNREHYKNCRNVEWKKKGVWKTDHNLAIKTLTDITEYPSESANFKFYYEKLFKLMEDNSKIMNITNQPLNQILFGPPGTGKTYSTVEYAYKIINGDDAFIKANDYDKAKQWFKEELAKTDSDDRQLDFITFHQNYSYEDFVMGIKPDLNEGDGLSFTRHEGIFYKICQRALKNLKQSSQEGSVEEPTFYEIFDEFIQPLVEENKPIVVPMKSTNFSFKLININEKSIGFEKQSGGTNHTLSIKTIQELYDGSREYNLQGLGVYYNPLLETLRALAKKKTKIVKSVSLKNYVIIIDEINRANISRVFGELITLIEDDKRWGNEHAMELRLPDGHTKFTVPKNLYIIGTMNTADKSIALLDIALRRRFEFTALYPDNQLVNEKYRTFFEALNKDIIAKKGIDFTIGHSYFMTKPGEELDFVKTMNKKVIPLLCEYFYNPKDNKKVVELIQDAITKAGLKYEIDSNDYQIFIKQ